MKQTTVEFQNRVLKLLTGKMSGFYLGGGTALSLYYFNHRESLDLDFFTQEFNRAGVIEIIKLLSERLKKRLELIAEESRKDRIKILAYSIVINNREVLKIDFVQDYLPLIKPPRLINGIKILSLEDIYIRKIFAITGTIQAKDNIGRSITKGGRQEAKDFYDLYCLSITFMPLSSFAFKYCSQLTREAIIRWFRTYSRLEMKTGLLELKLKNKSGYGEADRHFKKEVDKIIEKEVEFV